MGSVLVHVANLGMSLLSSGQLSIKVDASTVATGRRWIARGVVQGMELVGRESMNFVEVEKGDGKYRPNPCSFYLLNLAIDVSLPHLLYITQANCIQDNDRHSNPDPPPTNPHLSLRPHSDWTTTPIHPIRKLRFPTTHMVVVQTIHNLLHWAHGHENLCLDNLPRPSLDK